MASQGETGRGHIADSLQEQEGGSSQKLGRRLFFKNEGEDVTSFLGPKYEQKVQTQTGAKEDKEHPKDKRPGKKINERKNIS